MGKSWGSWWSGRQIASVRCGKDGAVRVCPCGRRRIFRRSASPRPSVTPNAGARPDCTRQMRPRAAVVRLLDITSSEPLPPLPALLSTLEQQQQAGRVAEARAAATARAREALEPAKPPATEPRPKGTRKARVRAGLRRVGVRQPAAAPHSHRAAGPGSPPTSASSEPAHEVGYAVVGASVRVTYGVSQLVFDDVQMESEHLISAVLTMPAPR